MKLVKLSVFALTMGLFLASCGGAKTEETKTDSTTMATTAPVEAPAAAPVDTTAKPAADTTAKAAPATETKMETKKTETKTTETKKK